MEHRRWENAYRSTLICVDSYQSENPTGRLYNPYWEQGRQFQGLTQMLLAMEELLDELLLPQPFNAKRYFTPLTNVPAEISQGGNYQGSLATFQVRVLFRQNASWQGSIRWIEGNKEESFRSVWEMVLLMHSALSGQESGPNGPVGGSCASV